MSECTLNKHKHTQNMLMLFMNELLLLLIQNMTKYAHTINRDLV